MKDVLDKANNHNMIADLFIEFDCLCIMVILHSLRLGSEELLRKDNEGERR